MRETSQVALDVVNVKKSYGKVEAVRGVSFQVSEGEIFGLLGPNGAGKTSLISIMTTIEKPTSGAIKIFGRDVVTESKRTKPLLGVVPQELINPGFFNLTEILTFQSGYYGISNNSERIEFLLNRLGLWEHRHKMVKQLSGGMKRRLMIAKALVHSPKLLLLDEPTAGVDLELRESLWAFVEELKKQNMTILLTTHYLQEAEALCDRVGVIHKGEMSYVDETSKIISDLSRRQITIRLKSERKIVHHFLAEQTGCVVCLVSPAHFQVGELLATVGIQLSEIEDLQVKEGGLEEAMRSILGRTKT